MQGKVFQEDISGRNVGGYSPISRVGSVCVDTGSEKVHAFILVILESPSFQESTIGAFSSCDGSCESKGFTLSEAQEEQVRDFLETGKNTL